MSQTYAVELRKKHFELQYGDSNQAVTPLHPSISKENMPEFMKIMSNPKIMNFMLGNNDNEKEAFETFEQMLLVNPDLLDDFHGNMVAESPEQRILHELGERLNGNYLSPYTHQKIYQELLQACVQYPNFIPLHNLASEAYPHDWAAMAFHMAKSAVLIGFQALERAGFHWEKDTLSWDNVGNRPFMRAYNNHILHLLKHQHTHEAIYHAERLLKVWHNDDLGVRFQLIYAYLRVKQPIKSLMLYKKYPEDPNPEMMFGRALAAYASKDKQQDDFLQAAIDMYPLVAKELCKKKHRRPSGFYGGYHLPQSAEEAFVYWEEFGEFWTECDGALAWLERQVPDRLKPKQPKSKS